MEKKIEFDVLHRLRELEEDAVRRGPRCPWKPVDNPLAQCIIAYGGHFKYEHRLEVDQLVFGYRCQCGIELVIRPGTRTNDRRLDPAVCPGCESPLTRLREALAAFHRFCEAERALEAATGNGMPGALTIQPSISGWRKEGD